MRYLIFLFLLTSFENSFAQKALQYSSFFQGRHFQFVLKFDKSGNIRGHCIDFQDKLKYPIKGNRIQPGNIYQLSCQEHSLFRYIRLKEDVNNQSGLNGFYYAPDGYIGHLNFNSRPEEFNFEESRDIETVNKLYRLMSSDFGFKAETISVPFLHDIESGLYVLNPKNGYAAERGIIANPRKLLLAEGLLHSFQEQKMDYDDCFYKQKLHFQVLGYSPFHSVLVISEEIEAKIYKALDTSYVNKFKLAVYTYKAGNGQILENWNNDTDKLISATSLELVKEKFPHCAVSLNANYIELIFNRKCRISPAIPRTLIYVPEQIGSTKNKTLVFNWQSSKLEIE
jgi:hypothetical protein